MFHGRVESGRHHTTEFFSPILLVQTDLRMWRVHHIIVAQRKQPQLSRCLYTVFLLKTFNPVTDGAVFSMANLKVRLGER